MLTTAQMRVAEESAVAQGINTYTLMENAGKALAKIAADNIPSGKKILILCLHGNNGGDGFVAARFLQHTHHVRVQFLGTEDNLSPEAKQNYDALPRELFVENTQLHEYDCIIDALLGTGAKGGLREPVRSIVQQYNTAPGFKIAADIPSGIDPDTGTHEIFFEPDIIVTFHDTKPGLSQFENKVIIADIGIP